MKWGIYDTQDQCWLGDDHGPKLFDSDDPIYIGDDATRQDAAKLMARCAAEVNDARMGWAIHRSQARIFPDAGPLKLKDELEPQMTTAEALRKKLSGAII